MYHHWGNTIVLKDDKLLTEFNWDLYFLGHHEVNHGQHNQHQAGQEHHHPRQEKHLQVQNYFNINYKEKLPIKQNQSRNSS